MPMCDAYIPRDALPAGVERAMLHRISELLIDHELRRAEDLVDDHDVEASRVRARALAWVSVLRHEAYVASEPVEAPHYKFVVNVPEGQADEQFRIAVTRDVTRAVADAEGGRWPAPERRVWVFTWEVPDGTWGAGGKIGRLGDVMGYLSPRLREPAEERLRGRRRDEARTLLAAAGIEQPAASLR
jgi:phenylpyruvate tautomerase PptA (4-oxalocrotonate tautomerase family)